MSSTPNMTVLHLPTAPEPAASAPSTTPVAEAAHLRRIVETQPACLMRVGLDGLLLAANDAALGLLGATDHGQVVGSVLTTWIVPADQDRWREFSATVAKGAAVSLECDIKDLSGVHRNVAFYAVPLVDHHDEIPSMILGARDESALRRLETSLQEAELRRQESGAQPAATPQRDEREWQDLRAQLEQSTADREELAALLIESDSAHKEIAAERERLQQALAKQSQLEQLLKTGKVHLQDLRKRVQDAEAERARLAEELSERNAAHDRLIAEQSDLKHTLSEHHQQSLQSREQEAQQHLDQLRAQLEETIAQRDQLLAQISGLETAHQQLVADQAELKRTLGEQHAQDLQAKDEEAQQRVNSIQAELEQSNTRLEQSNTRLNEVVAQLSDLGVAHQQLVADQVELQRTLVEQHERDLLAKEQEAEQGLNRVQAELEHATGQLNELREQLSHFETSHQQVVAEHQDLERRLREQHEQELLSKDQESQRHVTRLRSQLDEATTERDQFVSQLGEREAAHQQLTAEQAQLRQSLVDQHHMDLLLKEQEAQQLSNELRTRIEELTTEHQRLTGVLEEREALHQQSAADYDAERSLFEHSLEAAAKIQAQMKKTLADQHVELQSVDAVLKQLAPIAAAGRSALQVGNELARIAEIIDAQAGRLLAESSLDSGNRSEIEELRGNATRVAALALQIVRAEAEPADDADASTSRKTA